MYPHRPADPRGLELAGADIAPQCCVGETAVPLGGWVVYPDRLYLLFQHFPCLSWCSRMYLNCRARFETLQLIAVKIRQVSAGVLRFEKRN